jgi:hypothetical protein
MANFRPNMNKRDLPSQYPCACTDKEGMVYWQGYVADQSACAKKCVAMKSRPQAAGGDVSVGTMRKATGTSFQRRRKGGTGQPVQWRNAGGQIFGLTTQQALVAVAVGVAAYFIIKRVK